MIEEKLTEEILEKEAKTTNYLPPVEDQESKALEAKVFTINDELAKEVEQDLSNKTPQDLLNLFLAEEKNISMLTATAQALDERFHSNWFDLGQVIKKTRFKNVQEALQILNLLKFAKLLTAEMRNGVEKFKITLNKKAQISLLQDQRVRIIKELEAIDQELEKLKENTTKETI